MFATKITRPSSSELFLEWDDGGQTLWTIKDLRDQCPCAACKGERVLFEEYKPAPQDPNKPGRYELERIDLVGSYAIQITWGDSHNSGIYTWDQLRAM